MQAKKIADIHLLITYYDGKTYTITSNIDTELQCVGITKVEGVPRTYDVTKAALKKLESIYSIEAAY